VPIEREISDFGEVSTDEEEVKNLDPIRMKETDRIISGEPIGKKNASRGGEWI
jgi:hypothetical protein